jgi:hypothetical protein
MIGKRAAYTLQPALQQTHAQLDRNLKTSLTACSGAHACVTEDPLQSGATTFDAQDVGSTRVQCQSIYSAALSVLAKH